MIWKKRSNKTMIEFERRTKRPIVAEILSIIYGLLGWSVEIVYVIEPFNPCDSHLAIRCRKAVEK